jgi:DNA polymerase-3 subunit delta'
MHKINVGQINSAVMDSFSRLQALKKLGHAYLLVGMPGSGKTQTALALAQLVNCESPSIQPCGQCAVCLKIALGNHPDVHVIGNDEKESIKIDDIRFLLSRAHLKSYEARTKVFIIRNIELMTMEAANALLKTLEEPAPETLMILTTSVPEANLDTIKSRCHIVKFFPSPVNRTIRFLTEEGIPHQDAHFLAVYGEGCLGQIRRLVDQDILKNKQNFLDELLLNGRNEEFLKGLADDPSRARTALRLLLSFFRDVLLFKSGVESEMLLHQNRLKELGAFASRGTDDLHLIIRQIVQTKKLVDDRLNVKMSLSLLREYIWAN